MKVLNLRCSHEHGFEGWFGSEAEFRDQLARGLVTCPLCGDAAIETMPSAPRLNLGAEQPARPQPPKPQNDERARIWAAMRQVMAHAEDVGERFADEARRMHHGETEHRQIRGQASVADALELLEEGVPVLPLPDALKETLQ